MKLLEEAVKWNAPLVTVVYTEGTQLPQLPAGVRQVEVPADVMKSISPMEAPQGALFAAKLPDQSFPEKLTASAWVRAEIPPLAAV